MKLLDLFCGVGGAADGYRRAGFTRITGVDVAPQPRFPVCIDRIQFVQADAIAYLREHGSCRIWIYSWAQRETWPTSETVGREWYCRIRPTKTICTSQSDAASSRRKF